MTFYNPLKEQILDFVDKIVVKVDLNEAELEATKHINMPFRYRIWDGRTGNQMFTAEEDPTCFRSAKNLGSRREFAMPFVDAMGKEAFKLNKAYSMRADDCWFCPPCHSCMKHCCYKNID